MKEELLLVSKLAQKLNSLQSKIGELKPDGKNKQAGWSFISSNQLKHHLNRFMPEIGLICIPEVINHTENTVGKTVKGNDIFRTTVYMKMTIIDSETGYHKEFTFSGSDQDQAKSYAQAITDCYKRFWFIILSISEENEDSDGNSVYISKEDKKIKDISEKNKSRLLDIYNKSELSKAQKDNIVKAYKKDFTEDYSKWNEEVFTMFSNSMKKDD